MYTYELCRKYQEALNRKDLEGVLDLFTPNATVKAPMIGELDVETFHLRVFNSCGYALTRLTNVFDGLHHVRSVALQFQYTWTFPSGKKASVEGMSVFEFDEGEKRFRRLTVIYDPTEIRRSLKETSPETPIFHTRMQKPAYLHA